MGVVTEASPHEIESRMPERATAQRSTAPRSPVVADWQSWSVRTTR